MMPAPQSRLLSEQSKNHFRSKKITIPSNWSDMGDFYYRAFPSTELSGSPNPPDTLFLSATLNKYHLETAKTLNDSFSAYFNGISEAISFGISMWLAQSVVGPVIVAGVAGQLVPGTVMGPSIEPSIFLKAPKNGRVESEYSMAVAKGLSKQWQIWHMGLFGTIAYPAPMPPAPPSPSIPLPLAALTSSGESALSPSLLKDAMLKNLKNPYAAHANPMFEAIAVAFNTAFQTFKASSMIAGVIGPGPTPAVIR